MEIKLKVKVKVNGVPTAVVGNQISWKADGLMKGEKNNLMILWNNTDGSSGNQLLVFHVKGEEEKAIEENFYVPISDRIDKPKDPDFDNDKPKDPDFEEYLDLMEEGHDMSEIRITKLEKNCKLEWIDKINEEWQEEMESFNKRFNRVQNKLYNAEFQLVANPNGEQMERYEELIERGRKIVERQQRCVLLAIQR